MRKLPKNGIRESDIKKMIENKELVNVTVVQETMFSDHFRLFVDNGTRKLELYTQRAKPKLFANLSTVYKYCQDVGISQYMTIVEQNKDGL